MAQVYSDDPAVQAVIEGLLADYQAAQEAFEADRESADKLDALNAAAQSLANARKATRSPNATIITE